VPIKETGSQLNVLYLDNKLYCNRSLYSIKITDKNLEANYIFALLNSSLFGFYYISKFKSEINLFPKIRIAQVKLLPIRLKKQQEPYIALVDQILSAKADTSQLENQIDEMVYKLYELTGEEIAIIEGGSDGK